MSPRFSGLATNVASLPERQFQRPDEPERRPDPVGREKSDNSKFCGMENKCAQYLSDAVKYDTAILIATHAYASVNPRRGAIGHGRPPCMWWYNRSFPASFKLALRNLKLCYGLFFNRGTTC
jgi:hypothetical protein